MSKTTTKERPAATPKAGSKPEGSGAGRGKGDLDEFGCRKSSKGGQVNAVMKTKPQEPEILAEKSEVDLSTVKNHCTWMTRKGFFTKDDKGRYAIKG